MSNDEHVGSQGRWSRRRIAGSVASAVRSAMSGPWNGSAGAFAIDFRDGFARMLQVDQSSGAVVAAARVGHDPRHPERTAELVSMAAAGEGFSGRSCVVGIPLDLMRAEAMCVPDGHDADILAAIEREAPHWSAYVAPQVGFIRVGHRTDGRADIVAVVVDRQPLEYLLHALLDQGLVPEAAEPSFLASARASSRVFRRASDRSRVRLALDTSRAGATAMLLAGDRIAYARSTRDVDCIAEVAALCLHDGMPLVAEVGQPSEIRVAGAFAEDPVLTAALEGACGLPVRLDDERSTIGVAWRSISGRIARDDRPWEWSSALGLAFRSTPRWSLRAVGDQHRREAA